jgi:WXG100 family type VII secretion target
MPGVMISPSEVAEIAEEFLKASKDTERTVANLETSMTNLSSKWQGASHQMFYRNYTEWHDHALGFVQILSQISTELRAIAERFASADQ